jgi:hypothetical protein
MAQGEYVAYIYPEHLGQIETPPWKLGGANNYYGATGDDAYGDFDHQEYSRAYCQTAEAASGCA